jgi:simple sugar transport system permease protein
MNDTVAVLTIAAAIASGTTLVFASIGEILTERSGVINLGVEGMMLMGGVCSFWAASTSGNSWLAIAVGAAAGVSMALIHAVLAVSLRVSQIVSGLALVLIGTGLSAYLGQVGDDRLIDRQVVRGFPDVFPEALRNLPVIGPIVFGHNAMVYLSWAVAGAASYYLFHTAAGLSTRAVGEDPATADAAGIAVDRIRYVHVLIGGALAGVAGAYLTIVVVGAWQENITAGAGWIAFAMVIFSGWRPLRAVLAAYLFGGMVNLGFTFQLLRVPVPSNFLSMIPFVVTLIALIVVSSRTSLARALGAPAALAVPYRREER